MGDSFADYFRIKIKASATFAGESLPISDLDITYDLDNIPSARITVPVGRNASPGSGASVSPVGFLSKITPFQPIQIMLSAEPEDGRGGPKGNAMPSGSVRVFDGYVAGPLYERDISKFGLVISCFGKTGALAGSTRFVKNVVSMTLKDGNHGIVMRGLGKDGKANVYDLVAASDPTAEIYENCMLPLMQAAVAGNDANGTDNGFGNAALARLNKGGVIPRQSLSLSDFATGSTFGVGIAKTIADIFFQMWTSSADPDSNNSGDLWDFIQACAAVFKLHYIPTVEEDALIPLCPGIGGEAFKIIDPSEYFQIGEAKNFNAQFYSYYTKCAVMATDWRVSAWADGSHENTPLGYYELDTPDGQGQIKLVSAPPFLMPGTVAAAAAMKIGAANPDSVSPDTASGASSAAAAAEAFAASGIGNAYAEATVRELTFAQRRLAFKGMLRLDIGPGSLLQINTAGEKFIGGQDTVFGMVNSVNIKVGSTGNGSYASTSFTLSHVRSKAEQKAVTTPIHPLFTSAKFNGCPLVAG